MYVPGINCQLKKWKEDKFRKPLICKRRPTGRENMAFARDLAVPPILKLVYVNFEETPALQNIFSNDFDIERIITVLQ